MFVCFFCYQRDRSFCNFRFFTLLKKRKLKFIFMIFFSLCNFCALAIRVNSFFCLDFRCPSGPSLQTYRDMMLNNNNIFSFPLCQVFARNLKLPQSFNFIPDQVVSSKSAFFMLLFLLITLFSCQVLFIQSYLHMASHDAKSLNPRKWMSVVQKLFAPPCFVLYNWECFANTCSYTKLQVKS